MAGNALESVKKAEIEAEKIIEEAKLKSAAILSDAKEKAAQILKSKEEELAKKKAQAEMRRKEKLQAIRQKLLDEGAVELKSLRKSAEKKLDLAAESVLLAFEKEVLEL